MTTSSGTRRIVSGAVGRGQRVPWQPAASHLQSRDMPDLVIRDARIVDGTGAESVHGDVAVTGGRIEAVGRVTGRGEREVDAGGRVVSPGFIDLHTHYDCQLFWDRHATPSPWHGVTTVVMGNCGFTLAPCRPSDRHTIMRLLSFVEGMPLDTLQAAIPWRGRAIPSTSTRSSRAGSG
jgi:N-acyl-D-aspartate/D-glutamate deacylase